MDFEPSESQKSFQRAAQRFASAHVAAEAARIDQDGTFPEGVIRAAAAHGLLGVTVPREFGGAGHDTVSYVLAMEALARASATVAAIVVVQNSLVAEPIAAFGTDAQKRKWLAPLASGAIVGAFALSESDAGSDAANQQTVAEPDGGGYALTGRKVWIANAAAAEVAIVFAATTPGERNRKITAFLVPMDARGLTRQSVDDSLGVRGLGCMDLELNRVHAGEEAILGRIGEGFGIALSALDGGRVAIAAQALGIGGAALDAAIEHARTREQFGVPIGQFQAIQWMVADAATELDAARMLTWKAADALDRAPQENVRVPEVTAAAAMAKLLASEAAHRAADKALQILASAGYRRGSLVERLFRDARATEIYQGTSEVQRMIIAEQMLS